MAEFLSVGDIFALHRTMMDGLGQAPQAVRDQGALESAIMRPRMAEHYESADLVRQATLLAVSICQAHAFVDGNKRTAYSATLLFLRINGFAFTGDHIDFAKQMEAIPERTTTLDLATDALEGWLRDHVAARDGT